MGLVGELAQDLAGKALRRRWCSSAPEDPGIGKVEWSGDQVMRSRDLRNPPPVQFADRCDRPWRVAAPGPKASRAVKARALPVPSYRRRPPLAGRMLPPGVSHAGR